MLLSLLENDDQVVRISAGEAIAVLFETRNLLKSQYNTTLQDPTLDNGSLPCKKHFDNRETELIEHIRGLALEAGGKGQANKKSQRSSFKEILSVVEVLQDKFFWFLFCVSGLSYDATLVLFWSQNSFRKMYDRISSYTLVYVCNLELQLLLIGLAFQPDFLQVL